MKLLLNKLPRRYKWTIHNLIAHPLSEILYQAGVSLKASSLEKLGNRVHDFTIPEHQEETGRG